MLLIAAGVIRAFTGSGIGGLWLILLGWFMDTGAQGSYQQALLREALGKVRVGDIMTREVHTIDPGLTLDQAVADYFLPHKHGGFPVVWGDRLLGVITLHDVRDVPRERRATATVRDAMTPLSRLRTVRPSASAYDAFVRMAQDGIGRLLVTDAFVRMAQDGIGRLLVTDPDGSLIGILTRSDLLHMMRMRVELEETSAERTAATSARRPP